MILPVDLVGPVDPVILIGLVGMIDLVGMVGLVGLVGPPTTGFIEQHCTTGWACVMVRTASRDPCFETFSAENVAASIEFDSIVFASVFGFERLLADRAGDLFKRG